MKPFDIWVDGIDQRVARTRLYYDGDGALASRLLQSHFATGAELSPLLQEAILRALLLGDHPTKKRPKSRPSDESAEDREWEDFVGDRASEGMSKPKAALKFYEMKAKKRGTSIAEERDRREKVRKHIADRDREPKAESSKRQIPRSAKRAK